MKWTSVKDTLPEDGRTVLVKHSYSEGVDGYTEANEDYAVAYHVKDGWRADTGMITIDCDYSSATSTIRITLDMSPTHWVYIN